MLEQGPLDILAQAAVARSPDDLPSRTAPLPAVSAFEKVDNSDTPIVSSSSTASRPSSTVRRSSSSTPAYSTSPSPSPSSPLIGLVIHFHQRACWSLDTQRRHEESFRTLGCDLVSVSTDELLALISAPSPCLIAVPIQNEASDELLFAMCSAASRLVPNLRRVEKPSTTGLVSPTPSASTSTSSSEFTSTRALFMTPDMVERYAFIVATGRVNRGKGSGASGTVLGCADSGSTHRAERIKQFSMSDLALLYNALRVARQDGIEAARRQIQERKVKPPRKRTTKTLSTKTTSSSKTPQSPRNTSHRSLSPVLRAGQSPTPLEQGETIPPAKRRRPNNDPKPASQQTRRHVKIFYAKEELSPHELEAYGKVLSTVKTYDWEKDGITKEFFYREVAEKTIWPGKSIKHHCRRFVNLLDLDCPAFRGRAKFNSRKIQPARRSTEIHPVDRTGGDSNRSPEVIVGGRSTSPSTEADRNDRWSLEPYSDDDFGAP